MMDHRAESFTPFLPAAHKGDPEAHCAKEIKVWQLNERGSAHYMGENRAQAYAHMFDWFGDQLT